VKSLLYSSRLLLFILSLALAVSLALTSFSNISLSSSYGTCAALQFDVLSTVFLSADVHLFIRAALVFRSKPDDGHQDHWAISEPTAPTTVSVDFSVFELPEKQGN
jgi:hypothetical protein